MTVTLSDVHDQRQAEQLPIDHAVALAAAFRYGARSWTEARRLSFATDLENLVATTRSVNSAKSDHDAATWRPRRPYECGYAIRYVAASEGRSSTLRPVLPGHRACNRARQVSVTCLCMVELLARGA